MNDAGRGDYVTYREHIAAKEEAQKRQAAVEMEVATIRAALMHLPDDVRKLTEAVQALASKFPAQSGGPPSELTGIALAMQRTLDRMEKQPQSSTAAEMLKLLNTQPPGSGGKTWALVGALAVMAAMLAYQAFLG